MNTFSDTHNWFCFKALSASKFNMINTIHLGIGFMLVFFGFNSGQNFTTKIFGNLGANSLAVLYLSYAFCNMLAPSLIALLKSPRLSILIAAIFYTIYVLQFVYVVPTFTYIMSVIQGCASGLLWAAQGVYINDCSTEEDRGKKAGLFWAIFMMSNVFGNIASFIIIKILPIDSVATFGWNDNASILFLILGSFSVVGCLVLAFLRKPYTGVSLVSYKNSDLDASLIDKSMKSLEANNTTTITNAVQGEDGFIFRLKTVFFTLKDIKMWLMLPIIFSSGYNAVFIASHYARQIQETELIGICTCIYGIVEVIGSNILGWMNDKYGNTLCISIGIVSQIIALIISLFADTYQGFIIYIPAIFFGIADCTFNTQLMTLCGQLFTAYIDASYACLRMFQSFGSTLCFFLAPVFVTETTVIATHDNYIIEVIISGVLCVLGYIFYLVLALKYGTNWDPKKIEETKKAVSRTSSYSSLPISSIA